MLFLQVPPRLEAGHLQWWSSAGKIRPELDNLQTDNGDGEDPLPRRVAAGAETWQTLDHALQGRSEQNPSQGRKLHDENRPTLEASEACDHSEVVGTPPTVWDYATARRTSDGQGEVEDATQERRRISCQVKLCRITSRLHSDHLQLQDDCILTMHDHNTTVFRPCPTSTRLHSDHARPHHDYIPTISGHITTTFRPFPASPRLHSNHVRPQRDRIPTMCDYSTRLSRVNSNKFN